MSCDFCCKSLRLAVLRALTPVTQQEKVSVPLSVVIFVIAVACGHTSDPGLAQQVDKVANQRYVGL